MTVPPANVPMHVFDGDCGFCRIWIGYWKRLTGDTVAYAPYQEIAGQFPQVPSDNFKRAVQLILSDGVLLSGAQAVFRSLACVPGYAWMLWAYHNAAGFAAVSEWIYNRIAEHRTLFYHVTVFLWGKHI